MVLVQAGLPPYPRGTALQAHSLPKWKKMMVYVAGSLASSSRPGDGTGNLRQWKWRTWILCWLFGIFCNSFILGQSVEKGVLAWKREAEWRNSETSPSSHSPTGWKETWCEG
jgi:hypothetical protein